MIALQYVLIQSSFCIARGRVCVPLSAPPLSIRRTTWRQISEREAPRDRAVNKFIRPMTKSIKKGKTIRDGLMLPTANVVVSSSKSDPEIGNKTLHHELYHRFETFNLLCPRSLFQILFRKSEALNGVLILLIKQNFSQN